MCDNVYVCIFLQKVYHIILSCSQSPDNICKIILEESLVLQIGPCVRPKTYYLNKMLSCEVQRHCKIMGCRYLRLIYGNGYHYVIFLVISFSAGATLTPGQKG